MCVGGEQSECTAKHCTPATNEVTDHDPEQSVGVSGTRSGETATTEARAAATPDHGNAEHLATGGPR
mgnify:CR=1 FL=1